MSPDQIIVRPLEANEWGLYQKVRLKALQSDPGVFGSNYAREAAYTDEEWQARIANPDMAVFAVFHGHTLIGMGGVYINREDMSTAWLWGDWMEKDWRNKGLFTRVYEARIAWAKGRPALRRVAVSHRESNVASKKSHQKYGFTFTHAEDRVWADGQSEPHCFYELKL